jgi:hypothetical protein
MRQRRSGPRCVRPVFRLSVKAVLQPAQQPVTPKRSARQKVLERLGKGDSHADNAALAVATRVERMLIGYLLPFVIQRAKSNRQDLWTG